MIRVEVHHLFRLEGYIWFILHPYMLFNDGSDISIMTRGIVPLGQAHQ